MSECMNAVVLQNDEALELSAALTAFLASEAKVRCLFIKGPAAVAAGMRPARASADIDVLVHPDDVNRLIESLAGQGWKLRPFIDGVGIPKHSHTAYHPQWPTDIDIHFRFPGLDADPVVAFECLAEESFSHDFGGVLGKVPARAGMLIIQITHAMRYWNQDGYAFQTAKSDFDFILRSEDPVSWAELRRIMDGTHSWAAMKPFLLEAYPEFVSGIVFPNPSEDWLSRTFQTFDGKLRMVALLRAPWRDRPRILYRSIFPTREELASGNLPLLEADRRTVTKHQWARLLAFAKNCPTIFRQILQSIRNSKND